MFCNNSLLTPPEELPSGTPQSVSSLDKGGVLASGRASVIKTVASLIP